MESLDNIPTIFTNGKRNQPETESNVQVTASNKHKDELFPVKSLNQEPMVEAVEQPHQQK